MIFQKYHAIGYTDYGPSDECNPYISEGRITDFICTTHYDENDGPAFFSLMESELGITLYIQNLHEEVTVGAMLGDDDNWFIGTTHYDYPW